MTPQKVILKQGDIAQSIPFMYNCVIISTICFGGHQITSLHGFQEMKALYTPPQFELALRQASQLSAVCAALLYSSCLPILNLILAMRLLAMYWTSKFELLRGCSVPKRFSHVLALSATRWVQVGKRVYMCLSNLFFEGFLFLICVLDDFGKENQVEKCWYCFHHFKKKYLLTNWLPGGCLLSQCVGHLGLRGRADYWDQEFSVWYQWSQQLRVRSKPNSWEPGVIKTKVTHIWTKMIITSFELSCGSNLLIFYCDDFWAHTTMNLQVSRQLAILVKIVVEKALTPAAMPNALILTLVLIKCLDLQVISEDIDLRWFFWFGMVFMVGNKPFASRWLMGLFSFLLGEAEWQQLIAAIQKFWAKAGRERCSRGDHLDRKQFPSVFCATRSFPAVPVEPSAGASLSVGSTRNPCKRCWGWRSIQVTCCLKPGIFGPVFWNSNWRLNINPKVLLLRLGVSTRWREHNQSQLPFAQFGSRIGLEPLPCLSPFDTLPRCNFRFQKFMKAQNAGNHYNPYSYNFLPVFSWFVCSSPQNVVVYHGQWVATSVVHSRFTLSFDPWSGSGWAMWVHLKRAWLILKCGLWLVRDSHSTSTIALSGAKYTKWCPSNFHANEAQS